MSFRYSALQRILKECYRKVFPVPTSPYTLGQVDNICEINLVPREVLKDFYKGAIQKLQAIRGDDIGDYLEFGVFNGSSMTSMYLASKELGVSMSYYGFDAFEGLPEGTEQEDDGVFKKGFYTCSYDQMKKCLRGWDVDPGDIQWVRGWYDETLTQETKNKHEIQNIGIVMIDCDTYRSSKAVLKFIEDLIVHPVIVCFDDWKLYDLDIKGMGEYRSFNEFLEARSDLKATEIKSYNRKSKSFIVEPV